MYINVVVIYRIDYRPDRILDRCSHMLDSDTTQTSKDFKTEHGVLSHSTLVTFPQQTRPCRPQS